MFLPPSQVGPHGRRNGAAAPIDVGRALSRAHRPATGASERQDRHDDARGQGGDRDHEVPAGAWPAGPGMRGSTSDHLFIFDCDGVLVDSELLACGVQARAVTAYGLPLSAEDVLTRFLGMSAKDMRTALEGDLGRPLPDDHESGCGAELFDLLRRELKPVAGIADVVRAAGAAGHARCVASSSSPERIALALDVVGLHDLFRPNVFSSSMVA